MSMGSNGMGAMSNMETMLPDNTLPMISGAGQFGSIEMGGMFTVMKVREGLATDDYRDPGWYKHPEGTVAFEWKGEAPAEAPRAPKSKDRTGKRAKYQVVDPRKRPLPTAGHEH
jgi:hypothetical protein